MMQRIAEMPEEQTPEQKYGSWGWLSDPRTLKVAKSAFAMNFLVAHPYLSVYFHNPGDPYTTHQRLFVVFALLFSFLASNATFFGVAGSTFSLCCHVFQLCNASNLLAFILALMNRRSKRGDGYCSVDILVANGCSDRCCVSDAVQTCRLAD
jgi:hypothetical protein